MRDTILQLWNGTRILYVIRWGDMSIVVAWLQLAASDTIASSHIPLGHAAAVHVYCSLVWNLMCHLHRHSFFKESLPISPHCAHYTFAIECCTWMLTARAGLGRTPNDHDRIRHIGFASKTSTLDLSELRCSGDFGLPIMMSLRVQCF